MKFNIISSKLTHNKTLQTVSLAAFGAALLGLTACSDRSQPRADITTAETLKAQGQVDQYTNNNTDEQKRKIAVAFAALDQEIRELEVRVDATTGEARAEATYKLEELKKRRSQIQSDFNQAKFDGLINDIKNSVR